MNFISHEINQLSIMDKLESLKTYYINGFLFLYLWYDSMFYDYHMSYQNYLQCKADLFIYPHNYLSDIRSHMKKKLFL